MGACVRHHWVPLMVMTRGSCPGFSGAVIMSDTTSFGGRQLKQKKTMSAQQGLRRNTAYAYGQNNTA